jgi:hypothetical protein
MAIEQALDSEVVGPRIVEIAELASRRNLRVLCVGKSTCKFFCGLFSENSPFRHIALNVDQETQAAIERRLESSGYKEPRTARSELSRWLAGDHRSNNTFR